jgi:ABC-2 type transport system ATP-binding protein
MAILHFENVCKNYQSLQVFNHINLQIQQDEFFGLVGVNGAGKTTLIKSLLDFCEIDGGHITIFDQPHLKSQTRHCIAFLPEQFTPPYYLTGRDFLKYVAQLHHQLYDHTQALILCEKLDLAVAALNQTVKNYSKGMAQKLGLIACFLSRKPLLVLDEPMGGLDPKARAYLKRYLLSLKARGTTLFFSTHLLADVESLCDRMAILHEGQLRFIGTPAECCTQFACSELEEAYLRCIEG